MKKQPGETQVMIGSLRRVGAEVDGLKSRIMAQQQSIDALVGLVRASAVDELERDLDDLLADYKQCRDDLSDWLERRRVAGAGGFNAPWLMTFVEDANRMHASVRRAGERERAR